MRHMLPVYPENPTITVDLDAFDLEKEQGAKGLALAKIVFHKDDKTVTVLIDLTQRQEKQRPTLQIAALNKTGTVIRTIQVTPWLDNKTL